MCTEYQPGNLNHGGVYWAIKLTTHGDGGQTIWSDSRDNLRKIYSRIVQLSATNLGFLLHTLQCIFLAVHSALLASRRSYGMQWVLFLVTGVWRKRLWGVRCEDKIVELVSSVNQGGCDVWTGATGWLAGWLCKNPGHNQPGVSGVWLPVTYCHIVTRPVKIKYYVVPTIQHDSNLIINEVNMMVEVTLHIIYLIAPVSTRRAAI